MHKIKQLIGQVKNLGVEYIKYYTGGLVQVTTLNYFKNVEHNELYIEDDFSPNFMTY